jgi:hypothetical protein
VAHESGAVKLRRWEDGGVLGVQARRGVRG